MGEPTREMTREELVEENRKLRDDNAKLNAHINCLQEGLEEAQRKSKIDEATVWQYNAIISTNLGISSDDYKSPCDFQLALKERVKRNELPSDPIDVVKILIKHEFERDRHLDGTRLATDLIFSDLRQIAEHLLVYCRANESED